MARQRMVTRTVTVKTAVCKALTEADKIEVVEVVIPASVNPKKAIAYACEKTGKDIVKIDSYKTTEILYGMTEEKFIELAEVLPPRATK